MKLVGSLCARNYMHTIWGASPIFVGLPQALGIRSCLAIDLRSIRFLELHFDFMDERISFVVSIIQIQRSINPPFIFPCSVSATFF